jgi:hypothetical protein
LNTQCAGHVCVRRSDRLYLDTHFSWSPAKENARLHEQFRAGLGHDMRNTLAAMGCSGYCRRLAGRSQRADTEMQSMPKMSRQIADAMRPHQR